MDALPSLNALKAFETVARHLSFTRAAEELCVTQGAVSRQIKNLEEELSVQLFFRIPNNLKLTHAGEILFENTRNAFELIRKAQKQVKEKSSKLKIISAPTIATRWLIPRIYRLQERNPELQIQLETSVKRFDFRFDNDFDAAVIYGKPVGGTGLVCEVLFPEVLYPTCAPKLVSMKSPLACLKDLSKYCLLHSSLDRKEWKAWEKKMDATPLESSGDQIFELEESTIQAAKSGAGIALVNVDFIRDEITAKELIFPFLEVPAL